jgi:hypothetical protein
MTESRFTDVLVLALSCICSFFALNRPDSPLTCFWQPNQATMDIEAIIVLRRRDGQNRKSLSYL